jgi:NAD+ kinase
MEQFDSILIAHKPIVDTETQDMIECVRSYAGYRDIPIIYYPNDQESNVLIISIGGDGTMLNAMRISTHYENSTVIGFNTGTLGFLTEEVPEKLYNYLDAIMFERNVKLESRMILQGYFTVDDLESDRLMAVNEFVLTAPADAPLVTEVFINDQFVSKQLGSGMLVASSTGSTAMSLSAGGAIVSPSTNIMQIVPVLSHTLTARPIITSGDDEVRIVTTLSSRVPLVNIYADGQTIFDEPGEEGNEIVLTVKRHQRNVHIWRPKDWNFFNVLTEKMKW